MSSRLRLPTHFTDKKSRVRNKSTCFPLSLQGVDPGFKLRSWKASHCPWNNPLQPEAPAPAPKPALLVNARPLWSAVWPVSLRTWGRASLLLSSCPSGQLPRGELWENTSSMCTTLCALACPHLCEGLLWAPGCPITSHATWRPGDWQLLLFLCLPTSHSLTWRRGLS